MSSVFDIEVAARTLCQEARGEPLEGQQAVACVLKNRLASGRWGHSLSSVCLWNAHTPAGGQGFQFSGWRGQDSNFAYACTLADGDGMLSHMKAILQAAINSPTDMTKGAIFYFNPSVVTPNWADETQFCGQWGHQRFYRGTK